MDARELRIGNWVIPVLELQGESEDYERLPPCQVSELPIVEAHKFYEPIPITPEILERCGFEKINTNGTADDEYYFINPSNGLRVFKTSNGIETQVHGYDDWIKVKYLHQLQNIFYFLTGTELEFKEQLSHT